MNTQKGPYPIFTFYITSCRNVMPPGVYRQIFSNKKMSPPPPESRMPTMMKTANLAQISSGQSMWSMTLRYPHLRF